MKKVKLETKNGVALAYLTQASDHTQINVFWNPNKGAGFFVMFPPEKALKAISAAVELIEGEPLEPDMNITSLVEGALSAGTVALPKVNNIELGTPNIQHKAEDGHLPA